MKRLSLLPFGAWACLLSGVLAQTAGTELKVRLTAPLTTSLSRTGDLVSAKIIDPPSYAGGYLEGEVKDIHEGSGGKRSLIQFQFHTLHLGGKGSPITGRVVSFSNSKLQPDLDEDGAAVEEEKSGGGGFAIPHVRVPGIPGISKSGGRGAEKPTAGFTVTRLGSKAMRISFAPGSEFGVQLNSPGSK